MSDKRFILTIQNKDGSYDEVGMNNRRLYRSKKLAMKWAREWSTEMGRTARLEEFNYHTFYDPDVVPLRVTYIQPGVQQ